MAGINTLVDTLLHSVLGKRVDIPPQKDLNEPVRPTSPSEAPLAVRSDSRLEPGRVPVKDMPMPLPKKGGALPQGSGSPQPSIQANFSPAARAIAEVLARFPSPPSVLSSSAPLVAAGETPAPAELAVRLQSSIGESGLFYEHHLNRWYRGEMTLQQLQREPQMQWQQTLQSGTAPQTGQPGGTAAGTPLDRMMPSPSAGQGTSPPQAGRADTPLAPGQPVSPSPAQLTVSAPIGSLEATSVRGGQEDTSRPVEQGEQQRAAPARGDLPEHLQGIVRHQLELLSFPVLRWEGDIWSGLFLSMMIQLPEQWARREQSGDQDQEHDGEEGRAWRSELELQVRGLGDFTVNISLLDHRLDLKMATRAPEALARLEAGRHDLEARLKSCGFTPVIRFSLLEAPEMVAADGGRDGDGRDGDGRDGGGQNGGEQDHGGEHDG